MNNKELTELKKFIDGRIEFLFDHWVEHDKPPYTFGGWREEVVNDIANKLTSLNDDIKREAVEESMLLRLSSRVHAMFRDAIDPKSVSGYNEALDDVQDMIQEYLTQQSLDGGEDGSK